MRLERKEREMHAALKSDPWSDFVALFGHIFSDPALFLGPTTGQTAGLDLVTMGLVAGQLILVPRPTWRFKYQRVLLKYFGMLFPVVLLVNIGMALGSIGISGYLFAQFHDSLPVESWKQLWSGVAHVAVSVLVIAVCLRQVRRGCYSRANWAVSWILANAFWLYQLLLNTPPWLGFQDQLTVLLGSALLGAFASTVGSLLYLDCVTGRRLHQNLLAPLQWRGKNLRRRDQKTVLTS